MQIVGVQIPPPAPRRSLVGLFLSPALEAGVLFDASDRNQQRRAQARVPHRRAGERAFRKARRTAGRARPPGPRSGVPAGQGADAHPAPALRRSSSQRGAAKHGRDHLQRGDPRAQSASGPAAQARHRIVPRGRRSRIHAVGRIVARHPGGGFLGSRHRAARRRNPRRGGRSGARASCRAATPERTRRSPGRKRRHHRRRRRGPGRGSRDSRGGRQGSADRARDGRAAARLRGAAAGRARRRRAPRAHDLSGKEGLFTVRVKQVRRQLPLAIDDALAQAVGLETLDELRQEVRQSLQRNYDQAARLRLKRALLDKLAERYDFPVPPGMVELEFENLRAQFPAPPQAGEDAASGAGEGAAAPAPATAGEGAPGEAQAGEGTPAGDGAGKDKEEQERAAEYRRLAERRIRLGLLLAEIGRRNNITVSQEELNQALLREARRHPGHERQVVDYYRRNPDALGALRAPILEDKVIDFIVEMAKPPVRKVTPQELLTLPEPDGEPAAPA